MLKQPGKAVFTDCQFAWCPALSETPDFEDDVSLTLSEVNMSDGHVDVMCCGMTTVNHKTINKFHGLGSLTSQFSRHDYFTTLGSTLHNKP